MSDDLVRLELGDRVHDAIRAENFGLPSQCHLAIITRAQRWGWTIEHDADGIPALMRWMACS